MYILRSYYLTTPTMIVAIEWFKSSWKTYLFNLMEDILNEELKAYAQLKACDTRWIHKVRKQGKKIPDPLLLTCNWEFLSIPNIADLYINPIKHAARAVLDASTLSEFYHSCTMTHIHKRYNCSFEWKILHTFYSLWEMEKWMELAWDNMSPDNTITVVDANTDFLNSWYTHTSPDIIIDLSTPIDYIYTYTYGKWWKDRKEKMTELQKQFDIYMSSRKHINHQRSWAIIYENSGTVTQQTKHIKDMMAWLVHFLYWSNNEIDYDCD